MTTERTFNEIDAHGTAIISAYIESTKGDTVNGWTPNYEVMSGSLGFFHDDTEVYIYATPCWEGALTAPVQLMNDGYLVDLLGIPEQAPDFETTFDLDADVKSFAASIERLTAMVNASLAI